MDRLQRPRFTLKWTATILIGSLERIEWHTTLLALMRHMPRGRMDLFSLALISRSYTTLPYMACLIKEAPDGAQLALPRNQQRKQARTSQKKQRRSARGQKP